jgi:uncharacterized protein (DUF305 family)
MHNPTIRRAFAAGVAFATLATTAVACTSSDDSHSRGGHAENTASTTAPTESTRPSDVNDADVAFAQGMIPHHEQAVEMSDMVIHRGSNPDVIALAEQIKAAQGPEIEQMSQWLDEWGESTESDDHGRHDDDTMSSTDAMGDNGMMSDEEMGDLSSMAGADLDEAFLVMMIRHHEGAIDMARAELDDGSNPEALAVAQSIVDTQQAEIDKMKSMIETR